MERSRLSITAYTAVATTPCRQIATMSTLASEFGSVVRQHDGDGGGSGSSETMFGVEREMMMAALLPKTVMSEADGTSLFYESEASCL